MSHVEAIEPAEDDIKIDSLTLLGIAAERIGMKLVRDRKTYRWYGKHVGDYPLPEGFKVEDLGKCEHVLTHADGSGRYEVGMAKSRKYPGVLIPLYDFYDGSLHPKIGEKAKKLMDVYAAAYQEAVAKREARKNGCPVKTTVNEDGSIDLEVDTTNLLGY